MCIELTQSIQSSLHTHKRVFAWQCCRPCRLSQVTLFAQFSSTRLLTVMGEETEWAYGLLWLVFQEWWCPLWTLMDSFRKLHKSLPIETEQLEDIRDRHESEFSIKYHPVSTRSAGKKVTKRSARSSSDLILLSFVVGKMVNLSKSVPHVTIFLVSLNVGWKDRIDSQDSVVWNNKPLAKLTACCSVNRSCQSRLKKGVIILKMTNQGGQCLPGQIDSHEESYILRAELPVPACMPCSSQSKPSHHSGCFLHSLGSLLALFFDSTGVFVSRLMLPDSWIFAQGHIVRLALNISISACEIKFTRVNCIAAQHKSNRRERKERKNDRGKE